MALIATTLLAVGCGSSGGGGVGGEGGGTSSSSPDGKSLRAAALSLQSAMDTSSRAIDAVRGTRDALDRLGANLQPTVAQTSDVIVLLTPIASSPGTASKLLTAARDQRSFLQFAQNATSARTRGSANSALQRAGSAATKATGKFAQITQDPDSNLAGLLPTATAFNMGRIRDAVRNVNKKTTAAKKKSTSTTRPSGSSPAPSGSATATSGTDCGGGISVNSVTSCTFAGNVRDEYQNSGGSSVIEVYSPVTKQTYTMTCTGAGPTVCAGGNGAEVTFR